MLNLYKFILNFFFTYFFMMNIAMSGDLFQTGFESGDLSFSENGVSWSASNSGPNDYVIVDNEFSRTGSYSLKFHFSGDPNLDDDAWAEQRINFGGKYKDLWIEFSLFIPNNYYHRDATGSDNNKGIVQLWSGTYGAAASDQFLGFEQWRDGDGNSRISYHAGPGSNDMGHKFGGLIIDRSTDLGKWVRLTAHVRVATVANNDGIVEVWKQTEGLPKEKILDVTNLANYTDFNNYFTNGYFLGWSNSGFTEDTDLYIDDLVIKDTITIPKEPIPLTVK